MRSTRNVYFALALATLFTASCGQETPAPDAVPTTTAASPPPIAPTPAAARPVDASYDAALDWLRSTDGFRFTLRDGEVRGEGEVRRATIGAESMTLRTDDGVEWRAATSAAGVEWERREGAGWRATTEPAFGNRVYQRVTIPFDPQKKEGEAQLLSSDGDVNHYRFTDANTGRVHDLYVSRTGGHIERLTIGDDVEVSFTPLPER